MKRSLYLALLLLSFTQFTWAQKSKVTSGSMAYNSGDFEQALKLLNEALEKPELLENKDKAKAWFKKAQSYKGMLQQGDSAVLSKYPTAAFDALAAYNEAGNYDDLKIFEKERTTDLLVLGNIMYQNGFNIYVKAMNQAAANPEAFPVLLGQSIKYLNTASELQPDNYSILAILGSAYHYSKNEKSAQPVLEKSISLYEARKDPKSDKNMVYPYKELAEIYFYETKDATKAMALIEKAKTEFKDSKEFENLELNYYLQGDNIEIGIKKFEAAIEANPKSEEIHLAYASLLEKKGDIDGATKIYEKALILNPSSFLANYNIGAMYVNKAIEFKKLENETEDMNKMTEYSSAAETYFNKSLPFMVAAHKADNKDLLTINGLIQVYTQLGKMDQANEFVNLRNQLQGK